MTTSTKTKASVAGAKRKADASKEGPSKGSKKPKMDSVQGLNPPVEQKEPKKTNAVARRFILGALGIPVSKEVEKLAVNGTDRKKGTKVHNPQISEAKGPVENKATAQAQGDSSDYDFKDFDEDGGVTLNHVEDFDDAEVVLATVQQGVHPERAKANGGGVGPNSTILHPRLKTLFLTTI